MIPTILQQLQAFRPKETRVPRKPPVPARRRENQLRAKYAVGVRFTTIEAAETMGVQTTTAMSAMRKMEAGGRIKSVGYALTKSRFGQKVKLWELMP